MFIFCFEFWTLQLSSSVYTFLFFGDDKNVVKHSIFMKKLKENKKYIHLRHFNMIYRKYVTATSCRFSDFCIPYFFQLQCRIDIANKKN